MKQINSCCRQTNHNTSAGGQVTTAIRLIITPRFQAEGQKLDGVPEQQTFRVAREYPPQA
jgi:hypothetical protein